MFNTINQGTLTETFGWLVIIDIIQSSLQKLEDFL